MRIPQPPPSPPCKERPVPQMIHYLTDYYAMKEFKLHPVPFKNEDHNAFYNFYGKCTQISSKFSMSFNVIMSYIGVHWSILEVTVILT